MDELAKISREIGIVGTFFAKQAGRQAGDGVAVEDAAAEAENRRKSVLQGRREVASAKDEADLTHYVIGNTCILYIMHLPLA